MTTKLSRSRRRAYERAIAKARAVAAGSRKLWRKFLPPRRQS